MAIGLCRIPNGWANEDSVWVRYDNGNKFEIPAHEYNAKGYQPPIEQLPECSGPDMPPG